MRGTIIKITCLTTFLLLTFITISKGYEVEDFIDLARLKKNGDDWVTIYKKTGDHQGHIKLHQDKWLMFFVHWRPLTEENRNITPEYVRNTLLNFWGPNMNNFKLKGYEGSLQVNSHDAYYVYGTFNDVVKTRFIIWNCPETGRQFIADLNINIAMGTPEILHDLQQLSIMTISCHGGVKPGSILPRQYKSEKYNLSFYTPEDWTTNEFFAEKWFPAGMTQTKGTLWTLPIGREKRIELLWEDTKDNVSENLLNQFIKKMENFSPTSDDSSKYTDFHIDSYKEKNGILTAEGIFRLGLYAEQEKDYSDQYKFRGFLWKNNGRVYFLIASLINIQEVWEKKVDLSPSQELFDKYIEKEILPNIKCLDN